MTTEQKIVQYLANMGLLTQVDVVGAAMDNPEYAKILVTGDGIEDEVREEYGENIDGDCNHKSLSNDEIQEVFDNDEE
jgi:hypothetical protein